MDTEAFTGWLERNGVQPESKSEYLEIAQLLITAAAGGRVQPKHIDLMVNRAGAEGASGKRMAELLKMGSALIQFQSDTEGPQRAQKAPRAAASRIPDGASFDVPAASSVCEERVRRFLKAAGYRPAAANGLRFQRGSRFGSLTSFSPMKWKALAYVEVRPIDESRSTVSLTLQVNTTGQLVNSREIEYWQREVDDFRVAVLTGEVDGSRLRNSAGRATVWGWKQAWAIGITAGAIAIGSLVLNPPTPELEEFSPADGRFKVLVPGTPEEKTLSGGGMTMKTYSVQEKDGVFVVGFMPAQLPTGESEAQLQMRLDAARDGIVRTGGGTLTTESAITLSGKYPGREIQSDLPSRRAVLRARLYLVDRFFYEVEVIGRTDWAASPRATKFLDSLVVTP